MKRFNRTILSGLAAAAVIAGASISTSVAAKNFAGKTMKIVIPHGPGGTYDKYGVVFSNHLAKHIPGIRILFCNICLVQAAPRR